MSERAYHQRSADGGRLRWMCHESGLRSCRSKRRERTDWLDDVYAGSDGGPQGLDREDRGFSFGDGGFSGSRPEGQ